MWELCRFLFSFRYIYVNWILFTSINTGLINILGLFLIIFDPIPKHSNRIPHAWHLYSMQKTLLPSTGSRIVHCVCPHTRVIGHRIASCGNTCVSTFYTWRRRYMEMRSVIRARSEAHGLPTFDVFYVDRVTKCWANSRYATIWDVLTRIWYQCFEYSQNTCTTYRDIYVVSFIRFISKKCLLNYIIVNVTFGFYTSDRKVHVAYMGPTWVLSDPGGPHVGSMNLAIRNPKNNGKHTA